MCVCVRGGRKGRDGCSPTHLQPSWEMEAGMQEGSPVRSRGDEEEVPLLDE